MINLVILQAVPVERQKLASHAKDDLSFPVNILVSLCWAFLCSPPGDLLPDMFPYNPIVYLLADDTSYTHLFDNCINPHTSII